MPTKHDTQVDAPAELLYVPAEQNKQSTLASCAAADVAASDKNLPASQLTHTVEAVCAVNVLYFPATQIVQSVSASWREAEVPASER